MILELQRFILAAQEGNITKSAEKIFITQSALTQSIQRLEKILGAKLFIQKGKYLELTTEGKTLVVIGNKILQLWENAKNPELRNSHIPSYSIGMFDNAALRLGSYLQRTINDKSFHLELTIDNSIKLLTQLNLGVLDIAICVVSKKYVLPKNTITVETFSEELIPVSSKKFSGKLKSIPFILFNKESYTREQTDVIFAEKKIPPNIFAESTSTTLMKELAILGSGVALLPKNTVRSELHQGILTRQHLPAKWKREYGVYISEQSTLTKHHPIVESILKELHKY